MISGNKITGHGTDNLDRKTISAMFHNLGVAVMVIDRDSGDMILFNNKVCMDMEMDCDKIEGDNYRNIFTTDFSKNYERLVEECDDGESHTIIYYWATKLIWEQISARQFKWENDRQVILLTITNITEVAREEYHYERLAYFDSVTGLPNAKKLEEDINNLVDCETVALIYFQVKGFYSINSLYGFDAGDSLIIQIRDWLLMSEKRSVQMYKGSHGIIILSHDATLENVTNRTREILERFKHPWTIAIGNTEYSLYCRIKIGIVHGKYVKNEMRTILVRSLEAPETPEGYSIYDEDADREARNALWLSQVLVNSIHNSVQGFSVSYQPIVESNSERWVGAETLCRWHTPKGRNIPPSEFIRLAEELGLISKVDTWVRDTAMSQCVIWGLDKADFFLDVNFSSTQSVDDEFVNGLINCINKNGYPVEKLAMEVTESHRMEFDEKNVKGLEKLRMQGIKLSLDDFGTGYSSFENLIKIPATVIKTEKVFLDDIESNEYKRYLMKMLINLAHHLNMKIICEGVETDGQKMLLQEYGADYMQGFLFSQPLNRKEFENEIWRYNKE